MNLESNVIVFSRQSNMILGLFVLKKKKSVVEVENITSMVFGLFDHTK